MIPLDREKLLQHYHIDNKKDLQLISINYDFDSQFVHWSIWASLITLITLLRSGLAAFSNAFYLFKSINRFMIL